MATTHTSPPRPDLVSIVICAHDNWPDLELAIASALGQSYRPVEVIVVDNASADATSVEVPRRFGDAVRYLRQPNGGDAAAYNTGLAHAAGDVLQFMDGDDVLAPTKIASQADLFRERPGTDVVYGDVRCFQTLHGPAVWTDRTQSGQPTGVVPFLENDGDSIGSLLGVLIRRRLFDRVGPFDPAQYRADADYFLRAAAAGAVFAYTPGGPVAFKRMRPGQMGADAAAMYRGTESLWVKALGYLREPAHLRLAEDNLARVRFHRAVRRDALTRVEALALLRDARSRSPRAISRAACAAGAVLILLPGGRRIATARAWRTLRRLAARLSGFAILTARDQ